MRHFGFTTTAAVVLVCVSLAPAAPLLPTHWDQRNEYAVFAPEDQRLGCWSTAFAQILYYHRLAPYGANSYTCSDGTYVSANFDSHVFDWRLFVNRIDSGTPQASANEVALYSFYTSVVIEKDFGTDDYMLSHTARAWALEDHYGCDTSVYSLGLFYDMDDLKADIQEEIDAGRPLMLHMHSNSSGGYHAVAIDDYRVVGGTFEVHLNMGWEGTSDGYYDIAGAILSYDDTSYRKIITIRPPDPLPPLPWPVVSNDAYSGSEDNPIVIGAPGVLANDVDDDPMTAAKFSDPAHGSLALNSNGSFTYTPAANWFGQDSFTYKAFNGDLFSDLATVNLDIVSVNDAPVAVNDSYTCYSGETRTVYTSVGPLKNDADVEGSVLTAQKLSDPSHGVLEWGGTAGWFKYAPAAGFFGTDSFTYKASDGSALSNLATILLVVPVPGDANADGHVNQADAAIVAQYWGQSVTGWSKGDFNADGKVNAADAALMAANWGRGGAESATTPTPEPIAMWLLLSLGLLMRVRRQ